MKSTCVLAVVVLVAMASKMAEACCLPDQAKADVFYEINISMANANTVVSGIAAIAWNFTGQKFAAKFGPIMMTLGGETEVPLVTRDYFLFDLAAGQIIQNTDGPGVSNECLSWKVQGRLADEYRCMDNYSGLVEVMNSTEMTIYQMVDEKNQLALALDANCVPIHFQAATASALANITRNFDIQVDNIELEVVDDDFLVPCDNPKVMPGPPLMVPPIEKVWEVLSASMIRRR